MSAPQVIATSQATMDSAAGYVSNNTSNWTKKSTNCKTMFKLFAGSRDGSASQKTYGHLLEACHNGPIPNRKHIGPFL